MFTSVKTNKNRQTGDVNHHPPGIPAQHFRRKPFSWTCCISPLPLPVRTRDDRGTRGLILARSSKGRRAARYYRLRSFTPRHAVCRRRRLLQPYYIIIRHGVGAAESPRRRPKQRYLSFVYVVRTGGGARSRNIAILNIKLKKLKNK